MTAAELSTALSVVHWTPADLSRAAHVSERTVHRWLAGRYAVPERLGAWLEDLARYHTAHPAP